MFATHMEVLKERYADSGVTLDVSVHESLVLAGVFLAHLTHTGHFNNDFRNVRVVFDSPYPPGASWSHASDVSINLLPPSQFEISAGHIARAMTIELRIYAAHGSLFHIAEVWHGPVRLTLQGLHLPARATSW